MNAPQSNNRPTPREDKPPSETLLISLGLHRDGFVPCSKRGLFWPAQNVLIVADLHLGKEAAFCHAGIAVPRGSSAGTLQRIGEMIAETGSTRLLILGDLFHSRSALAVDVRELFVTFLKRHAMVDVTLVKGNHDRAAGTLPSDWPMEIVDQSLIIDDVELTHFPQRPSESQRLCIAGHLHPAVRLRGNGIGEGKLACFHYDASINCLTLPAIGEFTGTATIRPATNDRIWIVSENQVIEIDPRHTT